MSRLGPAAATAADWDGPQTELSAAELARFRTLGYVAPLRVLSEAAAGDILTGLDRFLAAGGPGAMDRLRTKAHLAHPGLMPLVRLPAILDLVESVLGPDLLCRSVSVFYKPAGDPRHVPWHQDAAYWGLEPPDVVSAWVAITDSNAANGALQVVPGSHIGALMPHVDIVMPDSMLQTGQISVPIDPAAAATLALRPGEMSLHHVKIAHGSAANRSAVPRVGVTIRYMAPHVRNVPGRRDSAMLVRGVDAYGHFDPEPDSWTGAPRAAAG